MLTTLKTAYTDTRAADLAWALGREPLPALAVLDLELTGAKLQLRLLGASHQVLLDEERGTCSETVACMPGSSTPLPLGVAKRLGEWDYEFAARVETLSRGSFAGRAQELLALVADHPNGLAGTFPGSPARVHGDARPARRGPGVVAHLARLPAGRAVGGDPHPGRRAGARAPHARECPTGRGTAWLGRVRVDLPDGGSSCTRVGDKMRTECHVAFAS